MARQNLTDRFFASRKAALAGQRQDFADAIVPGLALRVTDKGHKSFVLVARYPPNPVNPTRRALGDYCALTLDKAREKARGWLELIQKGKDPKIELRAAKPELTEKKAFVAVCADPNNRRLAARLRLGPDKGEGIAKKDEAQRSHRERSIGRAALALPESTGTSGRGVAP